MYVSVCACVCPSSSCTLCARRCRLAWWSSSLSCWMKVSLRSFWLLMMISTMRSSATRGVPHRSKRITAPTMQQLVIRHLPLAPCVHFVMWLCFRFNRLNQAQTTNSPQVWKELESCLQKWWRLETLMFHFYLLLFQSSAASSNLIDVRPQPTPLDQPAVITATSQPARNTTANQNKSPNRSEQALHNPFICVATPNSHQWCMTCTVERDFCMLLFVWDKVLSHLCLRPPTLAVSVKININGLFSCLHLSLQK